MSLQPQANCTSEGADTAAVGEAFVGLWRYFQSHDWDITWADPQVDALVNLAWCTPKTCRFDCI